MRLYTGDDFNYPELILGDGPGHSDALLGVFAAIYPAASTALQALDAGNAVRARAILDSTQEFGRHLPARPFTTRPESHSCPGSTAINPASAMVGGLATGRSVEHLTTPFRPGRPSRVVTDPEWPPRRMAEYLHLDRCGAEDESRPLRGSR